MLVFFCLALVCSENSINNIHEQDMNINSANVVYIPKVVTYMYMYGAYDQRSS